MKRVLVDANILPGMMTDDPRWYAWSAEQLDVCAARAELCINPILYAEVSIGFARAQGRRTSPLPDFYIGAHAAIEGIALFTRDAKRYHTYYPSLELICP